jgi:hypothetical protein
MPRTARNKIVTSSTWSDTNIIISKQCLSVKKCEEVAIYWDDETNCCISVQDIGNQFNHHVQTGNSFTN